MSSPYPWRAFPNHLPRPSRYNTLISVAIDEALLALVAPIATEDEYSCFGHEGDKESHVLSVLSSEVQNNYFANSSDLGTPLSVSEVRESVRALLILSELIDVAWPELNNVKVKRQERRAEEPIPSGDRFCAVCPKPAETAPSDSLMLP